MSISVILKRHYGKNNNKQACFLNTESLVLDIACKDLRNDLRSKDIKGADIKAPKQLFFEAKLACFMVESTPCHRASCIEDASCSS